MARLCKHGAEIGRIEKLLSTRAYFEDGTILSNAGTGWKLRGKLKAGLVPAEAHAKAAASYQEHLATRPSFAAYRKALHDAAGRGLRWRLHTAIQLMPDDCDGVWSTMDDERESFSLEEIAALCRAYKSAVEESDYLKRRKAA